MNLLHRLQLRVYLFWTVVIGFILLSIFMVVPFIGAIISAYVLAFLVRPLFLKLQPRTGNTVAAFSCIIISIILIVGPAVLISLEIIHQLGDVSKDQEIANVINAFVALPFLKSLDINTVALNAWIVLAINNLVDSTAMSIPSIVLGLVITLNGMFYLLCNWDELVSHLKRYLPFKNNDVIISKLGHTAGSIIHANVLISVLEAAVAFVGFSLAGVQATLILSALVFIAAFLPAIGPELVFGALALYYFSISQYATMLGVIITGIVVMVGIEFFFASRFVGSRSHIHPFIMLIGVLGGISVFGIFGFIIGPMLLVNTIKIIEEAMESHENGNNKRKIPGENAQVL